jgi:hypothetical protein
MYCLILFALLCSYITYLLIIVLTYDMKQKEISEVVPIPKLKSNISWLLVKVEIVYNRRSSKFWAATKNFFFSN